MTLNQQCDSLFNDDDLKLLSDGDLEGMVIQYFGDDYRPALDYLMKKRTELLKEDDKRKYNRLYYRERVKKERRFEIRLNTERDMDIIQWLLPKVDRTEAIKECIRAYIKGAN